MIFLIYIEKTKKHLLEKVWLFRLIASKRNKKLKKRYLKQTLVLNKDFLDNINGYSLDEIQRGVVVSEESSTLVVAGAGSGKSLTILARILYLIKCGIKPTQILVISFTNEACNNLRRNLIKNGIDLDVLTFHKLGLRILKDHNLETDIVPKTVLPTIINNMVENFNNVEIMFPEAPFITIGDGMEHLQRIIIANSEEGKNLKQLFLTFINLFKGANYQKEDFQRFLKLNEKQHRGYTRDKHEAFLTLASQIYDAYEYYLERNRQIDFHDMINKARRMVELRGIKDYQYIIIDEYQDTSLGKCLLLKAIKDYTGAQIMAVGDDFQSIYRFTGTNLALFMDFQKYFPNAQIFKLENTYRNSQTLLNIMGKIILKNQQQIPKQLKSNKIEAYPIYIYYYENSVKEVWELVVNKLESNDVLVLGRNNKDLDVVIGSWPKMTVHQSKGLEADEVILVNLEDKVTGFPNKIINDEVLNYVLDTREVMPFEEERRLFYVAMTRAKIRNHLLVKAKKPSLFVQELLRDNKTGIKVCYHVKYCPKCQGVLSIVREANNLFYSCSRAKCAYKRTL